MNFNLNELTGLNEICGKVAEGSVRLSMDGKLAVCTQNGYRVWDTEKKTMTNVQDLCLDIPGIFFVMPSTKVVVGDVILLDGKFNCVIEVGESTIKAIAYADNQVKEFVPERRIFMGKTFFFGKVVNLLGNLGGSGKLVKLTMLGQMLNNGGDASASQLMPLMLMGGIDGDLSGDGMLKQFMLLKMFQGGTDTNSLLPLMLLGGKGEGLDMKNLMLMQMLQGGQANGQFGNMLPFLLLGGKEGGFDGLFSGLFDEETTD